MKQDVGPCARLICNVHSRDHRQTHSHNATTMPDTSLKPSLFTTRRNPSYRMHVRTSMYTGMFP